MEQPPRERFHEYLATQGMRLTPTRATMVDEVFTLYEFFNAEQLIARLSQRTDGRRVTRSAVYRILAELENAACCSELVATTTSIFIIGTVKIRLGVSAFLVYARRTVCEGLR